MSGGSRQQARDAGALIDYDERRKRARGVDLVTDVDPYNLL